MYLYKKGGGYNYGIRLNLRRKLIHNKQCIDYMHCLFIPLKQSLMRDLTTHLSLIFNIAAGSASIIGIIIFAFSDATNAIIALSFFCLSLFVLLISIIWAIYSFVKRGNENNHLKVSVFTKFKLSIPLFLDLR